MTAVLWPKCTDSEMKQIESMKISSLVFPPRKPAVELYSITKLKLRKRIHSSLLGIITLLNNFELFEIY